MLKTILTVAGKPGLYKLISSGRNMLIVEAIDASKKRQPVHAADKVVSLGDIAMYTDDEEVPLWQVLENVKTKCEGAACSVDHKKASNEELADFFAEVSVLCDKDLRGQIFDVTVTAVHGTVLVAQLDCTECIN